MVLGNLSAVLYRRSRISRRMMNDGLSFRVSKYGVYCEPVRMVMICLGFLCYFSRASYRNLVTYPLKLVMPCLRSSARWFSHCCHSLSYISSRSVIDLNPFLGMSDRVLYGTIYLFSFCYTLYDPEVIGFRVDFLYFRVFTFTLVRYHKVLKC